MLPADLVGTWIAHWPIFSEYGDDPSVRSIVVSYSTNILISVLTALIAFRLLKQFGFSQKQSIAGVMALLFCTTHLHYTQNMMENNYIMLLTLVGFSFQYEWLRSGSRRALFAGSCALGLNLLTRLTTGLDLIAVGVFLLFTLWLEKTEASKFWQRLVAYTKVAAPVYLFFLLIDRVYQFYRYGSFTNTYVSVFAREYHRLDPTLPATFPWSTPLHVGVLGALFQPEKSIFLFDPLLILSIVLLAWLWERLTPELRAYSVTSLLLLLAYIFFYARYTFWSGDFAWGDRYVSTTVELATLLAVPLLMRFRDVLGTNVWRAGCALVAVSLIIQLASLAFWLPLEMTQDPWDYVHISTWNFLPFLLRRVGAAPGWVVDIALAVWIAGIAALGWTLLRLRSIVRTLA
jgi:hypothetical protein